ncbi:MAG: tRNA threonylcarbamoyladenosine dehydratase, partial [Eubacteriales bacterium]
LAKRMRKELKKMGIGNLKVVASFEEPKVFYDSRGNPKKASASPSSMVIVPAVAGMLLANEAITQITQDET